MLYLEKIPLKQRLITGVLGGIFMAAIMCVVYEFMNEPYDWKMPTFYFIAMGLFFGLSLKWKSSLKK